jgi:hypothetical protein
MRFRILLMAVAAASLSGCMVVSINPLFTENDLVFDEQLVGTWEEDHNQMVVEKGTDGSYHMTYVEDDERTDYRLSLLKLGDQFFWDMQPLEEPSDDDFLLLQTHLAVRVSVDEDNLTMAILDGDWLKRGLKQGTIQVDHQVLEDRVVLTGSTAELQTFFRSIAGNKQAFSDPAVYRRVK